jgi:mannose-1-phosphate guanylyltransferase
VSVSSRPAPTRALVLTAGLGTRLQPLTSWRAKPALPVAGRTLVERIIESLASQGVDNLILNLHHLPETITAILGDGAAHGVRIRYSFEQPLLGSAGGPRRAFSLVDDDRLWLVNGDTLASVDLEAMAASHAGSGALVTMAVIPNPDPGHYSGVLIDAHGAVTGFSRRGSTESSWHFVGTQLAERETFGGVPDGVRSESVNGIYPQLIASRPGAVRVFRADTTFLDIGTAADYLDACVTLAGASDGAALRGARTSVAPDATLRSTVLWDDVQVGSRVRLTRCVVTSGVSIPDDFTADEQAIEPGAAGGLRLTPIPRRN